MTFGKRCGLTILRPVPSIFGIGIGTIVLALNVYLAGRLHVWLSFAAAPDRRLSLINCRGSACDIWRLLVRELSQSSPHALGVDEFVLGRLQRSVRATLLDGRLARSEKIVLHGIVSNT